MPEWERVRLGEVVKSAKRGEAPQGGKPYRQVGVRLWGVGAYERDTIDGAATKYTQLFRVEEGDLIVNKIWARNGSVAVINAELAGSYCSNEFPVFEPMPDRVIPQWLDLITKWSDFWRQCDERSKGTSGQNRIKPDEFLNVEIPLPPLPEQRRIVARVKGLLEKVEEARGLRAEIHRNTSALAWSIHNTASVEMVSVGELVTLRQPDVQVSPTENYQFAGVYSFGRGVFVGHSKLGTDFAYPKLTRLETGNFTYPKLMAWEGAFGLVPPECDGLVVSTEFPVFSVNTKRVLPEVLDAYFKNPVIWPMIAGESTGTNARRRRLNPSDFLAYQFPLPTQQTQLKIAAAWRSAMELKSSEAVTIQLQALPASILARAFEGSL